MKHKKYNAKDIISVFFSVVLLTILPLFIILIIIDTTVLPADELAGNANHGSMKADTLQQEKQYKIHPYYDGLARFIAGMKGSGDDKLSRLRAKQAWQKYANRVNQKWAGLKQRKIDKLSVFASGELTDCTKDIKTVFYPFSGPDFLHVFKLFPDADRYIMLALEKPGSLPDINTLGNDTLFHRYISRLNWSMRDILNLSFFKTKNMSSDLRNSQIDGVLPVVMFFIARAGCSIVDISPIEIDRLGNLIALENRDVNRKSQGFRIILMTADNVKKEVIYISRNVHNSYLTKDMSLRGFLLNNGPFATYIKAASYLMHYRGFSKIRDIILMHSDYVLQDDSGIPVTYFNKTNWNFNFYGKYTGPISLFAANYQKMLSDYYKQYKVKRLDFGIGYKFKKGSSNLMLAIKRKN